MSFILEALTLGILYGLGPCTIFCAPVMVPLAMSFSKDGKDGLRHTLIFSFGRVISYAILGGLSGFAGTALSGVVSKEIVGGFIISIGVLVFLRRYPKKCSFIKRFKGRHASFSSGIMLGLSPCYPLIGLLSLAALSGNPITGLLMGLVFGLGTTVTPLLLLGFFAGKWAKFTREFRTMNIAITGFFLVLVGISVFLF